MNAKDKPDSREAEMAVLGAILLDAPTVIKDVMARVKEEYFYFNENRIIFAIIQKMFEDNDKMDILTVKDKIKSSQNLETVGGEPYLMELQDMVAYIPHVQDYVKIIEEKFVLRHLIETSKKITEACYSEADADEIIDMAESEIFKVQENRYKQDIISLSESIEDVKRKIEIIRQQKKNVTGIPTGFSTLDELTTGFHPGEFVVIAARPGVGKTSFALNMLLNACVNTQEKSTGLIFSLEMTSDQLIQRMLCTAAGISGQKLRKGIISQNDAHNISFSLNEFAKSNIYIDDSTSGTPIDIKAKARRLKREKDLDFLIVDYLQMMRLGRAAENKQIEVTEISRSMKLLAKELSIPVIALAQLSRSPEKRGGDKKPILSDIRDSGSIEQDADVVIFIHRKFETFNDANNMQCDYAVLDLAKQRNGPIGEVEVIFELDTTKFKLMR